MGFIFQYSVGREQLITILCLASCLLTNPAKNCTKKNEWGLVSLPKQFNTLCTSGQVCVEVQEKQVVKPLVRHCRSDADLQTTETRKTCQLHHGTSTRRAGELTAALKTPALFSEMFWWHFDGRQANILSAKSYINQTDRLSGTTLAKHAPWHGVCGKVCSNLLFTFTTRETDVCVFLDYCDRALFLHDFAIAQLMD